MPVADTLKAMFSDRNVKTQYEKKRNFDPKLLQDFQDGEIYQSNELLIQNPGSLEIILLIDAFSIVNQLASARRVFKI